MSVADYTDDEAIISINNDPPIAFKNLQNHLVNAESWFTKRCFKVNQSKFSHTTFTLG